MGTAQQKQFCAVFAIEIVDNRVLKRTKENKRTKKGKKRENK
jgi:hypothetical protein